MCVDTTPSPPLELVAAFRTSLLGRSGHVTGVSHFHRPDLSGHSLEFTNAQRTASTSLRAGCGQSLFNWAIWRFPYFAGVKRSIVQENEHNNIAGGIPLDCAHSLTSGCTLSERTAFDLNPDLTPVLLVPNRVIPVSSGGSEVKIENLRCEILGDFACYPKRFSGQTVVLSRQGLNFRNNFLDACRG